MYLFLFIMLTNCEKQKKVNQSTQVDSLDIKLKEISDSNILSGFSVSIFNTDSIFYQKSFGSSNLENKKPLKTTNIQIIASITKTLV